MSGIAFEVARSEVLTTVVLKNHVFCLACDTMLLSECNNILKEHIVFIFKYGTVFVSHSFLLQKHQYGLSLGYSLCVCAVITLLFCVTFPQGEFFGMFAKLRRATVSFTMSACPSTCNNSAPTRWIFMKFDISVFFENLLRKFKFD